MDLSNKKIILTGGGSGIGAGCVKGYVRAGANVVFCDVNDENGKAVSIVEKLLILPRLSVLMIFE